MIDLLLAVGCSLAIGVIFKVAARQRRDRLALLTANYGAAVMLAGLLLSLDLTRPTSGLDLNGLLAGLGIVTGALFIFGFFMLAWATEVAGMSLAIAVMRVSVVIPFLASWFIWDEVPTLAQGLGLAVAGVAFFLITRQERPAAYVPDPAAPHPSRQVFLVLALLFLAGGIVDVSMKTFDEVFAADNSRALFLLFVFGVAFLIGLVIVVGRGLRTAAWPTASTLAWGVGLGLVNYGSVEFFLRAIRQLSGPFVFPANNIAIMIGAALIGVFVWHEYLSRLNRIGLGLAALALVLLSL